MPKSQCVEEDYRKIKAAHPKLTLIAIADAIGVSVSTFGRMRRGGGSERNKKLFRAWALPYSVPPGWPPVFAELRQQYKWFDEQSVDVRAHFLDTIEPTLESHVALASGQASPEALCALWLLAWVSHDRADLFPHKAKDVEKNLQLAMSRYERATAIAAELRKQDPTYELAMRKLNVTSWVLYYNAQPAQTRSRDPKVITATKERGIVEAAKAVAEREPHDWSLIRNGLLAASLLKLADECCSFYLKLLAADRRFADWGYAPNNGKIPSLEDDPDLGFAREVLDEAH
jgi:hypothetical protein